MRLVLLFTGFLLLGSCKQGEKPIPERSALSEYSQIFLGNRLFSEKTCITCHDTYKKKTGPSIKEIMKVYKTKNGDIFAFLKGDAEPIVDTTASQVAIMQDNINVFLKGVSDEELKTINTYMLHVDGLNPDK
ncbi:MAG: cytochrome C [Maribacter sp.]|nr:MAG: cytochrome C [Maribacter sp.]